MAKQTRTQLIKLAEKFNLKLLYLFGSQARGDAHKQSDIDVAYKANIPLSPQNYKKFYIELQKIFSPLVVDLVNLSSAPPLLAYLVAREGRKIYGTNLDDDTFYRGAVMGYIDAKPIFEMTKNYVRQQIRAL